MPGRASMGTQRGTWALAVAALGMTAAVVALEAARVWRRRKPETEVAPPLLETADAAMREAVAVAVAGYETGSTRENALLNMLASFSATFAIVRLSTHTIRRRGRLGPFRNLTVGEHHIHHFVPGIALALLAGGASVLSRDETLDPWLALPFGTGLALTLDESALLLQLDDVYWTEEGVVSVQITFVVLAVLSAAALATRVLRRGEEQVLNTPSGQQRAAA